MKSIPKHTKNWLSKTKHAFVTFWRGKWWHKVLVSIVGLILGVLLLMYCMSRWYVATTNGQRFNMGVTFIPDYARALGVDPQKNMDALIGDLGVRQFRLVSYWNKHEAIKGQYDFSDLDWQFQKAEAVHAKVSLAIGLRQPRWPECHMPNWTKNEPASTWQPQLDTYIKSVIDRYKTSPSLASYQLENEYFNDFGECPNHDRNRLVLEYSLAKRADPSHPIIVSKSNNFPGGAFGSPQPDIVGVSVYRRVWDAKFTHAYFNYPLPAWYYGFNAGLQKVLTGKNSVIHELQMEPWPPNGKFVANISMYEQDRSINATMFADRVKFAKNTGMKSVDLWGAEWWYWRLQHGDSGVWNEAKKAFQHN